MTLAAAAESEARMRVQRRVGSTRGERDGAAAKGLRVDRPLRMFLVRTPGLESLCMQVRRLGSIERLEMNSPSSLK